MTLSIPAIDLSPFADEAASSQDKADAAAQLNAAAEQVGFFYMALPHLGLADAAGRLLQRCIEFHALAPSAKQAVACEQSPLRRGYNATWRTAGGSCAAKPGQDPPDPKELFMLGSEGQGLSPMHGPNQWPVEAGGEAWTPGGAKKEQQGQQALAEGELHGQEGQKGLQCQQGEEGKADREQRGQREAGSEAAVAATAARVAPPPAIGATAAAAALPAGWRASVEADWAVLLEAAKCLAAALAAALGEAAGTFDAAMEMPTAVLLFLRYDASHLAPSSTIGCGAHTDCGFLTLLAQQTIHGATLQVQRGSLTAGNEHEAGACHVDPQHWVDVPPLEGHVLVNFGDMLARWTNGRYRSTVHRVLLDPSLGVPRHSVAFFANPTYHCEVKCFPSCCAPAPGMPPPQFEAITAGRYISGRLGLMYEEKKDAA